MICEHCQQREASVTITKVQHGEKFEQHYCDVCAPQFHPFSFTEKEEPISLHQLLSGWFTPQQKSSQVAPQKKGLSCPTCQLTYRGFLKQGKFGCADCYKAFADYLPQLLQRIQAGTKHIDEAQQSKQEGLQEQLRALREQLQQFIAEEKFEEAITCRDQIRALEGELHDGGVSS